MFHQLHCLVLNYKSMLRCNWMFLQNQIREALYRDHYPEIPIHGPVHLSKVLFIMKCLNYAHIVGFRSLYQPPATSHPMLGKHGHNTSQMVWRISWYICKEWYRPHLSKVWANPGLCVGKIQWISGRSKGGEICERGRKCILGLILERFVRI